MKEKGYKQFEKIYRELSPTLILYARKYVDAASAEDIVQNIFLKVWKKSDLLDWSEKLKSYLFQSVKNSCLDYLKHQKVKANHTELITIELKEEEIEYNSTINIFDKDERLTKLYAELDNLPPRCKDIFKMYYFEEKKSNEIANLLDISPRTVETQLYRALKQLRNAFLSTFFIFIHIFLNSCK